MAAVECRKGSSLLIEKLLQTVLQGRSGKRARTLLDVKVFPAFCVDVSLYSTCSRALKDSRVVRKLSAIFPRLHPDLDPSPQRLPRCCLLCHRSLLHYA